MKLTKKRKEILEIILKSQKPITAKFTKRFGNKMEPRLNSRFLQTVF